LCRFGLGPSGYTILMIGVHAFIYWTKAATVASCTTSTHVVLGRCKIVYIIASSLFSNC
jgi:hypothetical protein